MMRIGIAADHGGFILKEELAESLRGAGYEVVDFGAINWTPGMTTRTSSSPWPRPSPRGRLSAAWRSAAAALERLIAANKVPGVRAGLIHDVFSAHQGVEDDDMNVFCLGGKVIGSALALELIETFLTALQRRRAIDAAWRKCRHSRTEIGPSEGRAE